MTLMNDRGDYICSAIPVFPIEADIRVDTEPLFFPRARTLGVSDVLNIVSMHFS